MLLVSDRLQRLDRHRRDLQIRHQPAKRAGGAYHEQHSAG
jgi:hypothetical protein